MNTQSLISASGDVIAAGEFVRFLVPIESAVAGPYRFEGYREDRPYFSIAGIDFPISVLPERSIEKLDWNEWKRPDFHLDRFLRYFYARQNPAAEQCV